MPERERGPAGGDAFFEALPLAEARLLAGGRCLAARGGGRAIRRGRAGGDECQAQRDAGRPHAASPRRRRPGAERAAWTFAGSGSVASAILVPSGIDESSTMDGPFGSSSAAPGFSRMSQSVVRVAGPRGRSSMSIAFGTRRAEWVKVADVPPTLTADELARFEAVDLFYRSLCAPPLQLRADVGPPRGLDLLGPLRGGDPLRRDGLRRSRNPDREDADIVSYAAGHKAMGLYAMWALRDEIARVGHPALLAGRRGAAPAPRGPARLPTQPDHGDAALPEVRREGPRRAPDAGDAVRPALDRRLRRRRRELDRPRPRRARLLRRRRRPASTSSRARAA